MRLFCLVTCTLSLANLSVAESRCTHNIPTKQGFIRGHGAPEKSSVCEYLGIPYAAPPTDDLRFAPPRDPEHTSLYIAASPGADCPQTTSSIFAYLNATAQYKQIITNFANSESNHTQSEDCLTLNVWSKASSSPSGKPVIIFFYGGRYAIGSSNTPYYDGQFLADSQDVIVVTLNYRLTIFGFSGAPGLTQNVALLDQRKAVEWVRDNIASFGGDPSSIIIDGQSSGAVAVDNWSYAFKDDPIVHGLISQSGTVFSFPLNSADLAATNWYNVSSQLGCGSSGDTVQCMRSKNISAILSAVAKVPAAPGNSIARSQPSFQATIDNATVFNDYDLLSSNGDFAPLPYLQGINDYEAGYYRIPALAKGNNPPESTWTSFQLTDFTCPSATQALHRADYKIPTWRYRYFGDWENLRLYPGSRAYHGVDMEMVIGNSAGVTGVPPSADEEKLTKNMQGAWTAFARDPKEGLIRYGWPAYNKSEATLIRLGYNNSPVPSFVLPGVYDGPCARLNLSYYNVRVQ